MSDEEPSDAEIEALWRAWYGYGPDEAVMGNWIAEARQQARRALRAAKAAALKDPKTEWEYGVPRVTDFEAGMPVDVWEREDYAREAAEASDGFRVLVKRRKGKWVRADG